MLRLQLQQGAESTTASSRRDRILKYVEQYHYVLPSSRYDYMPYPAKECGEGPDYDPFFRLGNKVRSRYDEDRIIYENLFRSSHSNLTGEAGTYIELGAYDGSVESNTHFYDKCLGWKGLLIEGNPDSYHKVMTNRRFAHKMSFAPSCSAEYEQTNHTIPFYRYPMTNVGLVGSALTYIGKPTVDVPCGPLTPVLQDVFGEQQPIHFFSLDVEGAERLVLDTIDFSQVTIYVLMIEIKNNNCQNDSCLVRIAVREKMKQEGYLRYSGLIPASDVYVHPKSPYQIPVSVRQPQ